MKKIILILAAILLHVGSFCDTIDYVQVYYNDLLLVQFQPSNEYFNVDIQESTFKKTDSIKVKYFLVDGDEKTIFLYNVHNQNNQPLNDIGIRNNGAPAFITKKYLASDFPLKKGNIYYFTITSIVNKIENPPLKFLKISFI